MTLPNRVLRAARAFVAAASDEGHFSEDLKRVDINGRFDEALLSEWRSLAHECSQIGIGTFTVSDQFGETVDLPALSGQELCANYRIVFLKRSTETTFYYFDAASVRTLVNVEQFTFARRVLIADDAFHPFSTRSCVFEEWVDPVPDEISKPEIASVNPQQFVRAINDAIVPATIGNVLMESWPMRTSAAFEEWKAVAITSLRRSLVNEVWLDGGEERVVLFGPRKRNIAAGKPPVDGDALLKAAMYAAEWVYDSGRDREARHAMLTYELAREWPDVTSWNDAFATLIDSALDAAKRTYRAHLGETSKETWSALNDVRKGLTDEIARVMQQSRDLASAMWRDLAVAAGAIIARLAVGLTGDEKVAAISVPLFMGGTAIYLAYSLFISLLTNAKFNDLWTRNTAIWRKKLYVFLSAEDIDQLADQPIRDAFRVYKLTAWYVSIAYVIAIGVVLFLTFSATSRRPSATLTPTPSARLRPTSLPLNPHERSDKVFPNGMRPKKISQGRVKTTGSRGSSISATSHP